jgi:aryl-alcohol dehydrogenase-like predicted oxidoreductase
MNRRAIPGTSLVPSVICLGTGSFGTGIRPDECWRMLDRYVELGGNFVDTAHYYGSWVPGGTGASETAVGTWLSRPGSRDRIILATKGGHPTAHSGATARLSPAELGRDLRESLERLRTDHVDLYWLHQDDPAVPVGEVLGVLNEFVAAGRVRAIGASNWTVARQEEAATYARDSGLVGFCASQIGWSLAQARTHTFGHFTSVYMDDATWEYHRRTSVPVMAYSSQAQGFFFLTGRRGAAAMRRHADPWVAHRYLTEENLARLERARQLAGQHGRTANDVALAYLLSQPFPVYPIIGPQDTEQLVTSCSAHDLRLSADEVAFLEGKG